MQIFVKIGCFVFEISPFEKFVVTLAPERRILEVEGLKNFSRKVVYKVQVVPNNDEFSKKSWPLYDG